MKKIMWALGVVLALFVIGCGIGGPNSETKSKSVNGPAATKTTTPPVALAAKDFEPSLKIKGKECFGSAGCNVRYGFQLAISDEVRGKLDRDGRSYEVTYEVRGGQDGPQTDTVTIGPDGTFSVYEGFVQTASRSTKLTVKITRVERMVY